MLYAKYVNEYNGYPHDIKKCRELLTLNEYYEVESVSMGQSHTSIRLKDFYGSFNSVNFDFYIKDDTGEYIPHDIYSDPTYRYCRG